VKRPVLFLVLLCALAQPAAAHQCILEGSSADAIQRYNSCKADLAAGTAHQNGANHGSADQSAELVRLQAENAALRAQLAEIRRRLLALLGDL